MLGIHVLRAVPVLLTDFLKSTKTCDPGIEGPEACVIRANKINKIIIKKAAGQDGFSDIWHGMAI